MALLEVKGLTTKVSGYTILNNLDFSIEENELRVLLGPNGAGKTTLIAMITGQFKPTSGKIYFNGQDITGSAPDEIFLAGISRKFQVPNMYETLSVYDNVMISLQGDRKVFKYMLKRVTPEENRAHLGDPRVRGARRQGQRSGRHALARRAAVARDGDAGRVRTRSCCCSMSRRPE